MISREPSREPSSTQINSISRGTAKTFWTTSRSVAHSLYTGITTESFMARLREGETPPKSITIVNRVCDDARVRIQEGVKDFPLRTLADKILCEQSEWEADCRAIRSGGNLPHSPEVTC